MGSRYRSSMRILGKWKVRRCGRRGERSSATSGTDPASAPPRSRSRGRGGAPARAVSAGERCAACRPTSQPPSSRGGIGGEARGGSSAYSLSTCVRDELPRADVDVHAGTGDHELRQRQAAEEVEAVEAQLVEQPQVAETRQTTERLEVRLHERGGGAPAMLRWKRSRNGKATGVGTSCATNGATSSCKLSSSARSREKGEASG